MTQLRDVTCMNENLHRRFAEKVLDILVCTENATERIVYSFEPSGN